jgi:biotin carboxyl carrier protein
VEAMKTFNAIKADKAGKVVQILKATGEDVEEDDALVIIQ